MADEPKESQPPAVPTGEQPASKPSPVSAPAAKPADAPAAPAKPAAPPAPPKPPVVLQTPLNNEMVARYRAKFGAAIVDAIEDRKQAILVVESERLRLKAQAAEGEEVLSVVGVWVAANWMEREAFDMFGIVFSGHPNLKRMLLPD